MAFSAAVGINSCGFFETLTRAARHLRQEAALLDLLLLSAHSVTVLATRADLKRAALALTRGADTMFLGTLFRLLNVFLVTELILRSTPHVFWLLGHTLIVLFLVVVIDRGQVVLLPIDLG